LRRITEIADLDLDHHRDRLSTQVALTILEILGSEVIGDSDD
jgi:DNA-binding PucR family transcriptional regulator